MARVETLHRPDLLSSPEEHPLTDHTLVTIGGGRGIGAAENILFASLGADIVTVHRDPEKEKRNRPVLKEIEATDSRLESIVGDITEQEIQQKVLKAAQRLGGTIVLNINAAGGATGEEAKEVARKLNVEMPPQLVDLFLPYLENGGVILYPESLWSKYYNQIVMLPDYERVARTKNQAAGCLASQVPEWAEKGVSLRLICGQAVRGTFMIDQLFARKYPRAMAALEQTCPGGNFPTAEDMAVAAAYSLLDTNRPSGRTIYVLGKGVWGYFEDEQAEQAAMREYIASVNQALAPFGFGKGSHSNSPIPPKV